MQNLAVNLVMLFLVLSYEFLGRKCVLLNFVVCHQFLESTNYLLGTCGVPSSVLDP